MQEHTSGHEFADSSPVDAAARVAKLSTASRSKKAHRAGLAVTMAGFMAGTWRVMAKAAEAILSGHPDSRAGLGLPPRARPRQVGSKKRKGKTRIARTGGWEECRGRASK